MSIITLTGPTCAGKSTIEAQLQQRGFGRAISHTTRSPRAGEVSGQHYHFVSDDEFTRLDGQGKFVEKIQFGSARYSMSADAIKTAQAASDNVVIVADPHGVDQIRNFCRKDGLRFFAIWVDCGEQEQARRWIKRMMSDMVMGKEVVGAYSERLAIMLGEEVQWRQNCNYGLYDMFLLDRTRSPQQNAEAVQKVVSSL